VTEHAVQLRGQVLAWADEVVEQRHWIVRNVLCHVSALPEYFLKFLRRRKQHGKQ
jgi:hypothetical protein